MIPDEALEELLEEPWLAFWLEDGDEDLFGARTRFAVAQRVAVRELRAHNETIEVRMALRGMLTTCYIAEYEQEGGEP